MPESASAVSQIAEEEHKGEKQMKERVSETENVRDTTEAGKKEIRENVAQ